MANDVTVPRNTMEIKQAEIDQWIKTHAGSGSARYAGRNHVRHWLNGDDWLSYDLVDDDNDITVFVFRNEQLAVEFALRFC